jgi:hypothetical protein
MLVAFLPALMLPHLLTFRLHSDYCRSRFTVPYVPLTCRFSSVLCGHVLKLMSSRHNLGFQALGYDNISTYTSALLICYSGGLAVATPPICYYFFQ